MTQLVGLGDFRRVPQPQAHGDQDLCLSERGQEAERIGEEVTMRRDIATVGAVVFLVALFCIAVVFLAYDQPWNWGLERRLDATRVDIASQYRNYQDYEVRDSVTEFERMKLSDIMTELCLSTPLSLESPDICGAYFIPHYDPKQAMLRVYWLENFPSPDTIRVVWSGGRTLDFPMLAGEINENREISRNELLYSGSIAFPHGSPEETQLLADPAASVVLVRAGKEVSRRMQLTTFDRSPEGEPADSIPTTIEDARLEKVH